jgi:hypothetical protein
MDRDRAELRLSEIMNDLSGGLSGLEALLQEAHAHARRTRERFEMQTWPTSEAALRIAQQIIQHDLPALEEYGNRAAGIASGLMIGPAELHQIAQLVSDDAGG